MGGQSNGDIDKLAILPEDSLEVEKHRRKEKPKMASTWPEMFRAWPKTTFLIVSNEFCERFSFYGMRTVLTLYLLNILKFNDNTSTVFFNAFNVLCYTTPVLGSILADGYIGKFKTIFSVSILYAIGQCVLAGASTQNSKSSLHPWLDFAGLIIIAFGTGGIKPCVSAFGADQFEAHEERMIGMYFSVFYFSINAGSMISTFVSPIFRSLPCLGQDSCYPMAFGIPAALMITATVVFIVGSFWYKKPPPKENVFGEVWRLGSKAVSNKMKSKGAKKEHWLLYYLDTHDCQYDAKCIALQNKKRNKDICHKRQFVDDVRSLLRVLVMFLPVPIFWAIYDQQGSLWTIQALEMNCRIWGEKDSQYLLLPDQMQTLNAVLILAFIPIFQIIIYPVFSFCIKLTPLRKMVAGGVIAAISMVVTALVQFKINTTLADIPPVGQSYVSFVNGFDDCGMTVTWLNAKNDTHHYIGPREALTNNKNQDLAQLFSVNAGSNTWRIDYNGTCDYSKAPQEVTYKTNSTVIHYVFVSEIGAYIGDTDPAKPTQGNGDFKLGIDLAFSDLDYKGHLALCRAGTKGTDADHPCDPTQPENFYFWEDEKNTAEYNDTAGCGYDDTRGEQNYTQAGGLVYSTYQATQYTFKPVRPGNWSLYYLYNTAKCIGRQSYSIEKVKVRAVGVHIVRYEQGGVYLLVINGKSDNPQVTQFQVGPDNVINILWQVPQIVIITAAEILFSITGYEFAYTQCAPSMKALVQAAWLLTTAAGDTIIALVQLWAPFNNMAIEFLAYAGLMLAVMFIFALMCIFYYEYNYYTGEDAAADDDEEDDDTHTECASEVGKSSRLNSAIGNGTANKAYKAEDDDDDVWNTKF